jgi:HEAT repeat protein
MGIRSNTSKLLFILAVICAYGLAMADQSTSNATENPAAGVLKAVASCSTDAVMAGEPVVVELYLQNVSEEEITYVDFKTHFFFGDTEVTTLHVDGRPVTEHITLDVHDAGYKIIAEHKPINVVVEGVVSYTPLPIPREAFVVLKPGEKVAYLKVDLQPAQFIHETSKQAFGPLHIPGEHTIEVEYHSVKYHNGLDGRQFGLNAWTGKVRSNVVTVRVKPERLLEEVKPEVSNLLSKLRKLEDEHLKIHKEKWDAMSDAEKRGLITYNGVVMSGLEKALRTLSEKTARRITAFGEAAVPILLEHLWKLSWESDYGRRCIRDALRQIGRPAVLYLIEGLQGRAPTVKVAHGKYEKVATAENKKVIIYTLGQIGDSRAVELLLELFDKNKTSPIRWTDTIATALGFIGDKRAVEPLIFELAACLGRAQESGEWDADSLDMRAYARALCRIGDKRAIPVLKKALNAGPQTTKAGKKYRIAQEAAWSLRSLGVQVEGKDGKYRIVDVPESAESYELRVSRILQRLYTAMEKAYADVGLSKEDIQGLLSRQQPPQKAMGKWKSYQETWPAIVKARNAAIEQMASLGPSAVTVLLEAKDKSDERRGVDIFVSAITKIGKTAVPALIDGLSHVDVVARVRAATSLGKMRDKRAVKPLIRSLSDPDKRVVGAAVSSLGRLKDIAATEPLLELWHKGQIVSRTSIASALGQIGEKRAAEPIMAALEECVSKAQQTGNWDMNSWAVMRVYAGALGKIGDPRAIPLLKKMLDAPPQRTKAPTPLYLIADAAARALRSLGLEVTGDREKGGYKLIETALNTEVEGDIRQERIGM